MWTTLHKRCMVLKELARSPEDNLFNVTNSEIYEVDGLLLRQNRNVGTFYSFKHFFTKRCHVLVYYKTGWVAVGGECTYSPRAIYRICADGHLYYILTNRDSTTPPETVKDRQDAINRHLAERNNLMGQRGPSPLPSKALLTKDYSYL